MLDIPNCDTNQEKQYDSLSSESEYSPSNKLSDVVHSSEEIEKMYDSLSSESDDSFSNEVNSQNSFNEMLNNSESEQDQERQYDSLSSESEITSSNEIPAEFDTDLHKECDYIQDQERQYDSLSKESENSSSNVLPIIYFNEKDNKIDMSRKSENKYINDAFVTGDADKNKERKYDSVSINSQNSFPKYSEKENQNKECMENANTSIQIAYTSDCIRKKNYQGINFSENISTDSQLIAKEMSRLMKQTNLITLYRTFDVLKVMLKLIPHSMPLKYLLFLFPNEEAKAELVNKALEQYTTSKIESLSISDIFISNRSLLHLLFNRITEMPTIKLIINLNTFIVNYDDHKDQLNAILDDSFFTQSEITSMKNNTVCSIFTTDNYLYQFDIWCKAYEYYKEPEVKYEEYIKGYKQQFDGTSYKQWYVKENQLGEKMWKCVLQEYEKLNIQEDKINRLESLLKYLVEREKDVRAKKMPEKKLVEIIILYKMYH